ncbi:MAG: nitrilase [Firmicutes bacterium]|nr:nitrilase [Bacillota bacterium]
MEIFIEKWFSKKLSLKRIGKYLRLVDSQIGEQADYRFMREEEFNSNAVIVACVQREIKLVNSVEKYIDMLHGFVKQASREKCNLIVFPEYNFFDLFGLIPGFRHLNNFINKSAKKQTDLNNHNNTVANDNNNNTVSKILEGSGGATLEMYKNSHSSNNSDNNSFLAMIFRSIAIPIETGIKRIFSYLAKKYGIYIYTGSYVLKEGRDIYNAGFLFDPDGNCIGTQRKTHLVEFEKQVGFKRDCKLEVFPFNPKGCSLSRLKIAIPVCMDATYFETFAAARKEGADIVAIPIANMEEYNPWRALRGIWPRVQESYVYGLKASLNGWIAGMHFTGKAGIFAPIGITPEKNGVMAIAPHYEGNYLITASLDMEELHKERERAEYHGDRNYEFERKFLNIYKFINNT